MRAWREATEELDKEYRKATEIVYFVSILVFNRVYGWKKLRIEHFLDKAVEVYVECRSNYQMSLVEMCDREMNIEVRNESNKSYTECPYLCQEDWERKKEQVIKKMSPNMQRMYLIRVRQLMKEWMFPQVLASILLALHRKEGFGIDRVNKFVSEFTALRDEFSDDRTKLKAAVEQEVGMYYTWTKDGDFALIVDEAILKGITG